MRELERLLLHLPVPVIVVESAGDALHVVFLSEAARRIVSVEDGELDGRALDDVLPSLAGSLLGGALLAAARGEGAEAFELVLSSSRWTVHTVPLAAGRAAACFSAGGLRAKDLGDLAVVQHETPTVRAILENVPNMIFVKRAEDLRFVLFNRAGEQLLGYGRDELLGKNDYDLFPKEEADFFTSKDRAVLSGREVVDIPEEPIHTRFSGTRILHTKKVPVFDEHGRPKYLLGISEDITDRKRAEQAIRDREDLLRQKRQAEERQQLAERMLHSQKLESLGLLAGGIAHDFNNILTGILGNADLALLEVPAASPTRELLAELKIAAMRGAELARQMLAYSGRGRFEVRAVDLNALVEEMAKLLKTAISKKARLEFDLAPALPMVRVDATQIRQVVMNLITNASDALGDRAGKIGIRTFLVDRPPEQPLGATGRLEPHPGPYVGVEVSDDGVGMDEATRARMFDPFFTTKFAGRGLGLAAALGIVRGHGGAIDVTSEPGRGTSIRAFLPADLGEEAPPAESAEVRPEWRGTGTILVIDDEQVVRDVCKTILTRVGFDVITANDGLDGLERLRRAGGQDVIAVLLDMTMPRLDGPATLDAIRELSPDLPVVMMSGYDERDAASRLVDERCTSFIQKPFAVDDLVSKIREALRC